MKLSHRLTQKPKLNQTLRSWLPILQAKTDELKEIIEPLLADNPFAQVVSPHSSPNLHSNGSYEPISKESLFEKLSSQITPPLFPSQKSQDLANLIISCINHEGYFEYDSEILGEFDEEQIERIRRRFAYLEPVGVGAKNLKESFLFQLDDLSVEDEIYDSVKFLIDNFENLEKYTKMPKFEKSLKIIKKFKNPPAIEYLEDEMQICPDLFVYTSHKGIELQIADGFYPKISLEVWSNEMDSRNCLLGYVIGFFPVKKGYSKMCIPCWRPSENVNSTFGELFLGNNAEFVDKSAIYSTNEKFGIYSISSGQVNIELEIIFKDFILHGIEI